MEGAPYLFPELEVQGKVDHFGGSRPPILVKKNQKKPQDLTVPGEKYPVAVRCSCSSVWCPKCFKKHFAPKEAARMGLMDWRRTRMVTLTLNPANWVDGEDAYMWYKINKPIGRFIENLGRAGITVTDWTCNMEWHDNGYPHWHLLIEVDKPGKAGMIGQELLHKLWSWGDSSHRVHEYYFRSEERFKKFIGYFSKSGYLHKDKQHQIVLPGWASGQGWAGVKINRFSSKRISGAKSEEKAEEAVGKPEKRPRNKVTYATKHGRCGNQVEIWEVEVFGKWENKRYVRSFVGKYTVPYDLVINSLDGQFYEGYGYSFEGTTEFVCHILQAWEQSPPKPPEKRKEFMPALDPFQMNLMRERHFEAVFVRF